MITLSLVLGVVLILLMTVFNLALHLIGFLRCLPSIMRSQSTWAERLGFARHCFRCHMRDVFLAHDSPWDY